jgi:hypothetical protein
VRWADGAPAKELEHAIVELQVIDGPAIRVSPRGPVRADGSFVLRTYQPEDGAPAGDYRAIVRPRQHDEETAPPPPILDARWQSFASSPLKVTVKSEPNEIELKVERMKR